ncbi:FAD binding domain-containing protein [Thozetella sp. PMI_491]|nr:FAD binding domain-containing protein [Thozetella sp. PMI_491]
MLYTHQLGGAALFFAWLTSGQGDFELGTRTTGHKSCDAIINAGIAHVLTVPGEGEYNASIQSYWAGNSRQLRPYCILQPRSTGDVATALQVLSQTTSAGNWDVAVRGGGHSSWTSNNAARGVTIDLTFLNATSWAPCDQSPYASFCKSGPATDGIASIGGGANWGSVMLEIEKYGQTATAGREGDVGVGGLTLGGGLSFHSGSRGTAADDMVNFEVVLGNGTVVNANANENADLFRALKGGGNNFGVVTRFDMRTFAAAPGGIYGGLIFTDYSQWNLILNQLVRLVDINKENPADTEVVTFIYNSPGPPSAAIVVVNVDGQENTTSFAPLQNMPTLLKDVTHRTYGELITKYTEQGGSRAVWYSICIQNNFDILDKATQLFEQMVNVAEQDHPNGGWSVNAVMQPLSAHLAQTPFANNVLGWGETLTQNSLVWLIMSSGQDLEMETYLNAKVATLATEVEAYAAENGYATKWRYMNYVNPEQDPLGSYGSANVQFLKQVAARYDPQGFFQSRVSGGFKISRVQ